MSPILSWVLVSAVVVASASCALGGSVTTEHGFRSRFLAPARDLVVFLPPGHDRDPSRRYPVLYMHDGQNVFTTAPPGPLATKWRMDETAARLIAAGRIEPLIIVGIPNRPDDRTDELTPTRVLRVGEGGKGDLYGRMLVEEIKPFIDSRYRTRPGPADTGLCGASLGGLITLHLGLKYPAIFGKLCVMSPTISWDRWVVLREVEALPAPRPLRIWLDQGTAENPEGLARARRLRDALLAKGWVLGSDLHYLEAEGAAHSEGAWALRVEPMLRYLFPKP